MCWFFSRSSIFAVSAPANASVATNVNFTVTAQDQFQVHGDLVDEASGWVVVPHRVVGRP